MIGASVPTESTHPLNTIELQLVPAEPLTQAAWLQAVSAVPGLRNAQSTDLTWDVDALTTTGDGWRRLVVEQDETLIASLELEQLLLGGSDGMVAELAELTERLGCELLSVEGPRFKPGSLRRVAPSGPAFFGLFEAAHRALAQGKVQACLHLTSRGMALFPDDPTFTLSAARALVTAKQLERALLLVNRSLEMDANWGEAHNTKVHCLELMDRLEQAEQSASDWMTAVRDSAQAVLTRGRLRVRLDHPGAIHDLRRAAAMDPTSGRALLMEARLTPDPRECAQLIAAALRRRLDPKVRELALGELEKLRSQGVVVDVPRTPAAPDWSSATQRHLSVGDPSSPMPARRDAQASLRASGVSFYALGYPRDAFQSLDDFDAFCAVYGSALQMVAALGADVGATFWVRDSPRPRLPAMTTADVAALVHSLTLHHDGVGLNGAVWECVRGIDDGNECEVVAQTVDGWVAFLCVLDGMSQEDLGQTDS